MSRIVLIGAAGFIGTNLTDLLLSETNDNLVLVDSNIAYFQKRFIGNKRIVIIEREYNEKTNFNDIIFEGDLVIHLANTVVPSTKEMSIYSQINSNFLPTSNLLDTCIDKRIKKFIFISSGGTVYGKCASCPIQEEMDLNPISAYGLQKALIEKTIYLYNHIFGLKYNILRVANPYGPYQRPNSGLGVVTTMVYKILNNEVFDLYGDGTIERDFVYIYDVVKAILNVMVSDYDNEIFNVGSGVGYSINNLIRVCENILDKHLLINHHQGRTNDVPINYLCVDKYKNRFQNHKFVSLEEGIKKTELFFRNIK